MEKIKEEVPEKLRIAVLLSFISGYINAFTYNNAGELFAGAQTGNVIFIKQCKNTCDSSTPRVLVMRHVLVGYKCTKILVSIQGNLYVDTEQNRATKKLNCWELLKLV